MALHGKKQEPDDTPYKLLWMRTTLMTVLLANTPAQAESLLHSLEKVADGISHHVNVNKTEYMCFNEN